MLDHGRKHAINGCHRVADTLGYFLYLLDIILIVVDNHFIEFLVRDVHHVVRMSAPMHRILIDRYIHDILDVLLQNLVIELEICIENILDLTVNLKSFLMLEEINFTQFQPILKFSKDIKMHTYTFSSPGADRSLFT